MCFFFSLSNSRLFCAKPCLVKKTRDSITIVTFIVIYDCKYVFCIEGKGLYNILLMHTCLLGAQSLNTSDQEHILKLTYLPTNGINQTEGYALYRGKLSSPKSVLLYKIAIFMQ